MHDYEYIKHLAERARARRERRNRLISAFKQMFSRILSNRGHTQRTESHRLPTDWENRTHSWTRTENEEVSLATDHTR